MKSSNEIWKSLLWRNPSQWTGMKSAGLLRTRRDEGDLLVPIAKLEWRELINNACAHIIWVNIAVKEQEKDQLIIYVSCCYGQGVLIGPIYLPDSVLYLITGDRIFVEWTSCSSSSSWHVFSSENSWSRFTVLYLMLVNCPLTFFSVISLDSELMWLYNFGCS